MGPGLKSLSCLTASGTGRRVRRALGSADPREQHVAVDSLLDQQSTSSSMSERMVLAPRVGGVTLVRTRDSKMLLAFTAT